jgi:hypothetical protein
VRKGLEVKGITEVKEAEERSVARGAAGQEYYDTINYIVVQVKIQYK